MDQSKVLKEIRQWAKYIEEHPEPEDVRYAVNVMRIVLGNMFKQLSKGVPDLDLTANLKSFLATRTHNLNKFAAVHGGFYVKEGYIYFSVNDWYMYINREYGGLYKVTPKSLIRHIKLMGGGRKFFKFTAASPDDSDEGRALWYMEMEALDIEPPLVPLTAKAIKPQTNKQTRGEFKNIFKKAIKPPS